MIAIFCTEIFLPFDSDGERGFLRFVRARLFFGVAKNPKPAAQDLHETWRFDLATLELKTARRRLEDLLPGGLLPLTP